MKYLVSYDIETTGLDKTKDQIIQFAAIKIDTQKHKIVDSKNIFIQPVGNYSISTDDGDNFVIPPVIIMV